MKDQGYRYGSDDQGQDLMVDGNIFKNNKGLTYGLNVNTNLIKYSFFSLGWSR